jgi:hypothetical protein
VPIRLGFRSGAELEVEAKVTSPAPQDDAGMKQHDGGHGGHQHTH